MTRSLPSGVAVSAPITSEYGQILTPDALPFVINLHRSFEPRRQELLARRVARQKEFDAGNRPDFLAETREVRERDWTIAALPADLQCARRDVVCRGAAQVIDCLLECLAHLRPPGHREGVTLR